MIDFEKMYDDVKNLKDIYLPKLEALSNSGSSTVVHKSNNLISIIISSYANAEYWHGKNKAKFERDIDYCRCYLKDAEDYMNKIARSR